MTLAELVLGDDEDFDLDLLTVLALGNQEHGEGGRFAKIGEGITITKGFTDPKESAAKYKELTGRDAFADLNTMAALLPGASQGTIDKADTGDGIRLEVTVDTGRRWGTAALPQQVNEENGAIALEILGNGKARFEALFLPDDLQNAGHGKVMLKGVLDIFDDAGVTEIVDITAGGNVGGYLWARLGVTSDEPEELADLILNDVLEEDDYSPVELKAVKAVLKKQDGTMARRLADLKVGGRHIGKELLLGEQWEGSWNLRDPETLKRLKHYTGWEPKKK